MKRLIKCAIALSLGLSFAMGATAVAAAYPEKPIKWVVGFPPGGGTDSLARTIAAELSVELDAQVVVENKAGAAGSIAAQTVARSSADGYTLLTADIAILALNPAIYPMLQYDATKDFAPVGLMAQFPLLIATHPGSGITSMDDVIKLSREGDGLNYGSAGVGTPHHMAMEVVLATRGIRAQHVPYKGDAPALQDLVGGQVPVAVLAPSLAVPYVKEGKLVPLAITAKERVPQLPDVPTLMELNHATAPVYAWQGLVAPVSTPPEVLSTLSKALKTAVTKSDVLERLEGLGMEALDADSETMASHVAEQQLFWRQLIQGRQLALD